MIKIQLKDGTNFTIYESTVTYTENNIFHVVYYCMTLGTNERIELDIPMENVLFIRKINKVKDEK